MMAAVNCSYTLLGNLWCWWVQVHTDICQMYKLNNRTAKITSCIIRQQGRNISHCYMVFYTKNAMEDMTNFITQ